MSALEQVGAVTVALLCLVPICILGLILWGYVQAAGGYVRFASICSRKGLTTHKREPRPKLFALRMIHFQAWHFRDYGLGEVIIPWTFMKPIKRFRGPW